MPKKQFGTWQFDKIGALVNSVIQKLKSKYRKFSPYVNFITANFITTIFQNFPDIFS